jgi:hypothetical protein
LRVDGNPPPEDHLLHLRFLMNSWDIPIPSHSQAGASGAVNRRQFRCNSAAKAVVFVIGYSSQDISNPHLRSDVIEICGRNRENMTAPCRGPPRKVTPCDRRRLRSARSLLITRLRCTVREFKLLASPTRPASRLGDQPAAVCQAFRETEPRTATI